MMERPASPLPELLVHLASPAGIGGISLIEVHGREAATRLGKCVRTRSGGGLPGVGQVRLGEFLGREGEPVDEVLVSGVGGAGSWTTLPHYSISGHGGRAVSGEIVETLVREGARRVDRAELLELGVRHGSLDPLAPRAHPLLLEAATERAALYFHGMFEGAWTGWLRERVGRLLRGEIDREELLRQCRQCLEHAPAAIRLGRPLRILLAGPPNAGKSTLFNALLGEERVVVSERAGTTRDLIEETGEIEGFPVTWMDSAGLREGEDLDAVERAGIERARSARADRVLWVESVVEDGAPRGAAAGLVSRPEYRLEVRSQVDRAPEPSPGTGEVPDGGIRVSALTGEGLEELRRAVLDHWLGPPRDVVLPPAPFTPELERKFGELLLRIESREVDDIPAAFIECLGLAGDFPRDGTPEAFREPESRRT